VGRTATPSRTPIVVVGAGPVGLSLAIDLAQRGVPVTLLDRDAGIATTGSRAICFAQRTLEIFDRLGCGERMVDKGVAWNVGKVFFGATEVYRFDLLPEPGHERPAFINLQQYHVERYLAERAAELPLIDLRWNHAVAGIAQHDDSGIVLAVDTPDGRMAIAADHVVACDGARSTLRSLVGDEPKGRIFQDRFLIADVRIETDRPAERWFWFDPPFHPKQSVLLHMQPDKVWRVDFQLGWDADPEVEKRPENIVPRIRALFGADVEFTLEWASVYTFACRRMAHFRHGRLLFAGDAAHGVSPFGARGANSGIQDADNLGWKLARVVHGRAADALLDSYAAEREDAADQNIRHSTRSTDFITPKSEISRVFRDAVLSLSRGHAFARTLVNSGRLSTPNVAHGSPLHTADVDRGADASGGAMRPGAAAADAPLQRAADGRATRLRRERGDGFSLLVLDGSRTAALLDDLERESGSEPLTVLRLGGAAGGFVDVQGRAAQRYDLRPGSAVLLRPDRHVCARWRRPSAQGIAAAVRRALAATA
jgi:3-(3-hydroxy-phenyl)propionate hydroxylase